MKARDLFEFLLLAAIWGGSFLFMRIASPEFGVLSSMALRTGLASLALLPLIQLRQLWPQLRGHGAKVLGLGILNSGLPFVLFAYATLHLTAGFAAILNATAPFWGAFVGWLWLKDRLTRWQTLGLVIGFSGVLMLVWDKISFKAGGSGWAVLACLGATLLYGISANLTKKYFKNVDPMVSATGSQIGASLLLVPLAFFNLPFESPSVMAWGSVLALAFICTALAYLLYFRLMRNLGPSKAIAVTFLIPVFGMLWGALFLSEVVTLQMIGATAIILLGTSLTTGLLSPSRET